jgi:predicted outer membrane repeat protein
MKYMMVLIFLILNIKTLSQDELPSFEEPLLETSLNALVNAAEWSQNADYLAVATNKGLFILNYNLQNILTLYGGQNTKGISWKSDNTEFAVAHNRQVDIWTWSSTTQNAQLLKTLQLTGEALGVYWRPDATQLATLHFDPTFSIENGNTDVYSIILNFWDATNWNNPIQGQTVYGVHKGYLNNNMLSWIPNQPTVIILKYGYSLLTFIDSYSGQVIKEVSLYPGIYYAVSVNPLITNIVATGDDLGISFYDTNTNNIIKDISLFAPNATSLSWSPDGRYVYAGGYIADIVNQTALVGNNTFACLQKWNNRYQVTSIDCDGNIKIEKINNISGIIIPTFTPTPIPPTATPTRTPTPIPPSPTPTATSFACTHTVVASSTSSLISAIVSANSASTPSTICLGGGTYTLTAVNNSDESPNGLPSITKNITIIGNNSVIERATSAPQFRIFRVATNGRLSLNNLTVRGGHAGSLSGGGVRNLGILELNTVIVENNTGNAGGGIRNNNNATFTAINSLIRNNISTTNGGGLYANNSSSTILTNTNFLGNTTNASNGLGGAIFSNGNVFNMSGGIIQNNSARNGGGIFVNITTQTLSLNNVQFTGNTASNHGAGIYHLSGTTFSVQDGRFTSNIATNEGGAIAGDGTFTITNSNFLSNSANIGGAIHAQATSGSSIQQSCIQNNTAPNTIGIFNEATIVLNAQNNFWGSAGASGSVSANVNINGALTTCGNP